MPLDGCEPSWLYMLNQIEESVLWQLPTFVECLVLELMGGTWENSSCAGPYCGSWYDEVYTIMLTARIAYVFIGPSDIVRRVHHSWYGQQWQSSASPYCILRDHCFFAVRILVAMPTTLVLLQWTCVCGYGYPNLVIVSASLILMMCAPWASSWLQWRMRSQI